jgi:hypothetical protein
VATSATSTILPYPPLSRSHRSPDGGSLPRHIHRLAAGGYISNIHHSPVSTILPHPPLSRSHRSPDGGHFPRHFHRLAAGGYIRLIHRFPVATVRQTVVVFLATSTAWQRWLHQQHPPPSRSHRSPDGGSLPRHFHRLAAVATSATSTALATSTAWPQIATIRASNLQKIGLAQELRQSPRRQSHGTCALPPPAGT